MNKFFAIAILAFVLPLVAVAQQVATVEPSTAATTFTAEMLIGKYTGHYQIRGGGPRGRRGVTLHITNASGSSVSGTYTAARRDCSGELKMDGRVDGNILEISVQPPQIYGCEIINVRLAISNGGRQLDWIQNEAGTSQELQLSR